MWRRYTGNQKGWVLIDSLFGMIVVATALCALVITYTQTTKVNATTTTNTYATYLAQRTLEDLKRFDGGNILILPEQATATRDSIVYTINVANVNVATVANTIGLNAHLRPVQATISWQESGQDQQLNMISYYYIQ